MHQEKTQRPNLTFDESTRPRDIRSLLVLQSRIAGDHTALKWRNGSLTYRHLLRVTEGIVSSVLGYRILPKNRRPRIGLVHPNGPGISVMMLSLCQIGEAVPLNPQYSYEEIKRYLAVTRVDVLILPFEGLDSAVEAAKSLDIPTLRIDWRNECKRQKRESNSIASVELPELCKPQDIALVLLTSGSTGDPKVVPLTHENVCTSAEQVGLSIELSATDCALCMWEQHHIGGLVDLLLAPLYFSSQVYIAEGFETSAFFAALMDARPTWYQAVPTALTDILKTARRNKIYLNHHNLRFIRSVASFLSPGLQNALEQCFGVPVIQTYGMTEAGPLITSTRFPPATNPAGSVGHSCGTQIAILAENQWVQSSLEQGEVAIKGPNVFKGYEGDPSENSNRFHDGWFLTGDLGYLDKSGELFLTGRVKELINRGGEKVNPHEIDARLQAHPDIDSAVTVGIAHPTLGEQVLAAITLANKQRRPDHYELHQWVGAKLAAFKVPARFLVMSKIPTTAVGKPDRRATKLLVEQFLQSANRDTTAPRTALEAEILSMWKAELDVDGLGVHERFSDLGGDSLSSASLVASLESRYRVTLSEEETMQAPTVATMAALITKKTNAATSINDPAKKTQVSQLTTSETEFSLTMDGDQEKALEALHDKRFSRANLKKLADSLVTDRIPDEIIKTIQALQSIASSKISLNAEYARQFSNELEQTLSLAKLPDKWSRSEPREGVLLFSSSEQTTAKRLLVGFSGRSQRLMLPTHILLSALSGQKCDLLLVKDTNRDHFKRGCHGLGSTPAALFENLDYVIAGLGMYKSICTFGTSSGGIPAILYGVKRGCPCVAVGADNLDRQPHFLELFNALAGKQVSEVHMHASGGHQKDIRSASQLQERFKGGLVHQYSKYDGHNLLWALYLDGQLGHWVNDHLAY